MNRSIRNTFPNPVMQSIWICQSKMFSYKYISKYCFYIVISDPTSSISIHSKWNSFSSTHSITQHPPFHPRPSRGFYFCWWPGWRRYSFLLSGFHGYSQSWWCNFTRLPLFYNSNHERGNYTTNGLYGQNLYANPDITVYIIMQKVKVNFKEKRMLIIFAVFYFPIKSRGVTNVSFSKLDNLDELHMYNWGFDVHSLIVSSLDNNTQKL